MAIIIAIMAIIIAISMAIIIAIYGHYHLPLWPLSFAIYGHA